MEKPIAVKFYVPAELMGRAEEIFLRQGVKLSEGMTRLIRALVESPEEAWPVFLAQAQGDAAVVLAQAILAKQKQKPHRPGVFGTIAAKKGNPTTGT